MLILGGLGLFCFVFLTGEGVFLSFVFFFRATSVAYGGSQAGGQIRAVAAALHHSHRNAGSKLYLRPTPQLMATPDP